MIEKLIPIGLPYMICVAYFGLLLSATLLDIILVRKDVKE